jgi:hypothetical protein
MPTELNAASPSADRTHVAQIHQAPDDLQQMVLGHGHALGDFAHGYHATGVSPEVHQTP